jgi:HAD superfamily hydrolase (TIGR01458 family)
MEIKGILADLDGTLYVGDEPVAGAREALRRLKSSGILVRCVTNTTRRPRSAVHAQLESLGFEVAEGEIFTPARAAARFLGDRSCFPLIDDSLREDLAGVRLTDGQPDFVLVGDLGEGFGYGRLNEAFRRLMEGAGLLALQKNRYWLAADGLSLDAGPFVAALEYASGKTATVVGKPQENFFRLALEELGLEAGEVAMVGDDPESDVAGARAAGLLGYQVQTGKYRPGDGGDADLTVESFAGLPGALGL